MTFFEILLALLLVAIVLLQFSRRLGLPYPALLATAGVLVAAVPGTPTIPISPDTALALFIAPILIDAAYDFPVDAARALLVPLIAYAVVAVLVTASLVALIGWWALGLPIAAALALGAIVAPPDAAAATAVLSSLPVARRIDAVLKGESLFNDATTLLLFTSALAVQSRGSLDWSTGAQLTLAVPGGVAFGIGYGLVARRLQRLAENTVGGTLLQFLHAFLTWTIAEHLHLSAVLATVVSAMTMARAAGLQDSPRMRVHSFAVWTTVVFLLNVTAFLLMGLQARVIIGTMSGDALLRAAWFSGLVLATVIVARMAIAFAYRLVAIWRHRRGKGPAPLSIAETAMLGWTGMRGLVTLATAFALPADFPERQTVVLAAFTVVFGTLVVQGLTVAPLIRLLRINREAEAQDELIQARRALAEAALARLADEPGEPAERVRHSYRDLRDGLSDGGDHGPLNRTRELIIAAVQAQREQLERLRAEHRIGSDAYLQLQEDLDWRHLSALGDEGRRIAES